MRRFVRIVFCGSLVIGFVVGAQLLSPAVSAQGASGAPTAQVAPWQSSWSAYLNLLKPLLATDPSGLKAEKGLQRKGRFMERDAC